MIRLLALAFLVTPLAAAPVPKEVKTSAKLVGTWNVVSVSTNGQPSDAGHSHWTIGAEGILTVHNDPKPPAAHNLITFKYDMASKAIEYTSGDRNFPGLYELKGDTLKLCFTLTDQTRPKAVEAGQDLRLLTLTRVKPEEK